MRVALLMGGRSAEREVSLRSEAQVEAADLVVMHRVVCCYPDYEALLAAAGSHALRLLVFSHPPSNALTRALVGAENLGRRLRGQPFRVFVHPADAMVSVLAGTGLANFSGDVRSMTSLRCR